VRLGLEQRAAEPLDPDLVIPAPGQGALAIECLAQSDTTRALLSPMSDPETEITVACERGVMQSVGGNCDIPFGAYAVRTGNELRVRAMLATGQRVQRVERVIPWPDGPASALREGIDVGRSLLAQ